jgi:hypothetical protein
MSRINEKMGFKPAGKRSMMKLPSDRELRARVTSARCPSCDRTGARVSRTQPGHLWCSWCSTTWPLPEAS